MKKLLALICIASLLCTMALPVSSTVPKTREAQIFDALEILKYCVDMPNNAAQLMGKSDLSVFDALEILKGMVRMRAPVMVNVLKEPDEVVDPPVTTSPEVTTAPEITTEPPEFLDPLKEEIDFRVMGYKRMQYVSIPVNQRIYAARSLDELNSIFARVEPGVQESSQNPFLALPDIDESFFEDRAIVVVYTITYNTGQLSIVDSLEKSQNSLTVNLTVGDREADDAMSGFRIVLAVDPTDLDGIEQFSEEQNFMSFCLGRSPTESLCCLNGTCYPWSYFMNWFYAWLESKK